MKKSIKILSLYTAFFILCGCNNVFGNNTSEAEAAADKVTEKSRMETPEDHQAESDHFHVIYSSSLSGVEYCDEHIFYKIWFEGDEKICVKYDDRIMIIKQ